MEDFYAEVRLLITAKDGRTFITDTRDFEIPPTNDMYMQMLYEELSYTDFADYSASDIRYVVAVLDWQSISNAEINSPCTFVTNINSVWPDSFERDYE